jgi:hypothetical protein
MLDWVRRETLLDVSINAVPIVILLFLDLLFLAVYPWGRATLSELLTHVLTLFPIAVLAVATYLVARAIERDAAE